MTAIKMITSKESEALLAILERVLIAFSVMVFRVRGKRELPSAVPVSKRLN